MRVGLNLFVCFVMSVGLPVLASRGPGDSEAGGARKDPTRFEAAQLRLVDAAERVSRLLRVQVVLGLSPGHPARAASVSLSMPVQEPADLLNAVSAAYGLRWVHGPGAGRITLLDKKQYRSSPGGLRQAMADAVPGELQEALTAPNDSRLRNVEAILKTIGAEDLKRLEHFTVDGTLPIERLDPALARPLVSYLSSFSAYQLGKTADEFHNELRAHPKTPVRYGRNSAGGRQFSFRLRHTWLAVAPE